VCTLLHFLFQYFFLRGRVMMSQCILVTKTVIFMVVILNVQSFLLSNAGDSLSWMDKFAHGQWAKDLVENPMILWLVFESICFYASMASFVVLILISKVRMFNPIRDRVNLGSYHRSKIDFLLYRFDDLHWFIILF
jgi:hypothetical protein